MIRGLFVLDGKGKGGFATKEKMDNGRFSRKVKIFLLQPFTSRNLSGINHTKKNPPPSFNSRPFSILPERNANVLYDQRRGDTGQGFPEEEKRKRNRKKYQGGETKMQLWPPRRRRKKLWLFDRRFSKKTWGKLTVFFPDTKYRLSQFFFPQRCFFRESQKKPRISPLIRNWHSSRQSYRRRRSKGGKRHYVRYYCQGNGARSSWRGKEKSLFSCVRSIRWCLAKSLPNLPSTIDLSKKKIWGWEQQQQHLYPFIWLGKIETGFSREKFGVT